MLRLNNSWLALGVDEADGHIHTLRLTSPKGPAQYEYVESPFTTNQFPQCHWGQWELRDSFTTHKPSEAALSVVRVQNKVISRWENAGFIVTVSRELHESHLVETVALQAKQTMAVIDFNVAFRPAVTDFLDASNVSVGEHNSYIPNQEPRSAYHWFTGGNYAHLMFTQVTGRGPHLGVVLSEGRIHALTMPYLHGGLHLVNDYQAFSTRQMYPRLHVTSYATHKESDEYPQPILDLKAGDTETFALCYFPFEQMEDFRTGVRSICNQPTFDYPRFWPTGKELEIVVELPHPDVTLSAESEAKTLPVEKLGDTEYKLVVKSKRSGLHKVDIAYGGKHTFVLFEAVHDVEQLLDKRVNYILTTQQCLDPTDNRYGGIFITDLLTGKLLTRDDLYTVQVAGSGEMVATGQLLVYKNLMDPDPEQIARAELYANQWLRLRCQDEDFSTPLNPLNRLKYKDRGWKYEPSRARIFNNPDFPLEKAWRIHNANWIAPFYYLLSELPDEFLHLQKAATYLDWAYQTLNWQFETEPQMSADQSYFVPRVIRKLKVTGREEAATALQTHWDAFIARIVVSAQNLGTGYFNFDDSMFYCSAIPLLLDSKVAEAKRFLESFPYNTGLSYDPRVQTTFRYWDDYLTDLPYGMMPYLTRPHFWSITDSYPLLQLYEATRAEAVLNSAYQGILAFYEHYNYGYPWNKWGEMKLGQGHPCFLPSHDLHTQESVCADQDPAFVTYLETFGNRCYLTPSGEAINASWERERLKSWAPFPREYHLDDRNLLLTSEPYSVVMPSIELNDHSIQVLVKNLSRHPVSGKLSLSGATQQSVSISLAPHSGRYVDFPLGPERDAQPQV